MKKIVEKPNEIDQNGTNTDAPHFFISTLIILCVFVGVPMLSAFVVTRIVEFNRPILVLEYLAIGLLFPFFGVRVVSVLIGVTIFFELTQYLLHSFALSLGSQGLFSTFIELADGLITNNFFYIGLLSFGVVMVVATCTYICYRLLSKVKSVPIVTNFIILLMFGVIFTGVDQLIDPYSWVRKTHYQFPSFNLSGSAIKSILHNKDNTYESSVTLRNVPSATNKLFKIIEKKGKLPSKVVLIVLESIGYSDDQKLNSLAFGDLMSNQKLLEHYDIDLNSIHYNGGTVSAELRELCKINYSGHNPTKDLFEDVNCLPDILKKRGYDSYAIHGFRKRIFNRYHWWPFLKFGNMYFKEDLEKDYLLCGIAFQGICDTEIASNLLELELINNGKQFIYWLTLNTHYPFDTNLSKEFCRLHPLLEKDLKLCKNLYGHNKLSSRLASVFTEVIDKNEDVHLPLIIMVGDHKAPGLKGETYESYRDGRVPALIFLPKTLNKEDKIVLTD